MHGDKTALLKAGVPGLKRQFSLAYVINVNSGLQVYQVERQERNQLANRSILHGTMEEI